jgi:hypothetical protein
MLAGEPEHIGIEEQKEDEADGQQVHVKTEKDAGLEEIPLWAAHAADGVGAAEDGDTGGNDEEGVGTVVGKSGEEIRRTEAEQDKSAATEEGDLMRIEDTGSHAVAKSSYRQG